MNKNLIYILALFACIFSCKESSEVVIEDNTLENGFLKPLTLTSNPVLQRGEFPMLKEAIIDFQIIMEEIILNGSVSEELYLLGKTDFYTDHYIGLYDLLNPDTSDLYTKAELPSNIAGSFKAEFNIALKNHPEMVNLISYVKEIVNDESGNMRTGESGDKPELYLYCPYCSEISESDTGSPTIVPTTVEAADEAIGNKITENNEKVGVLVNDDYAAENLTYIVTTQNRVEPALDLIDDGSYGGGGNPSPPTNPNGIRWPSSNDDIRAICEDADLIRRVFIGDVKVKRQFDPLIGFVNSGASEMRILRIDGYLKTLQNGDIFTDPVEELISRVHKRKEIRNKRFVGWNAIWDHNWECDNTEQAFVIYEDDNNIEIDLAGSLSTKFKLPFSDSLVNASASFSTKIPSKDDLIRIWRMDGYTFFKTNLNNQSCGKLKHWNFNQVYYPVYDCGTDVEYTLPHNYQ